MNVLFSLVIFSFLNGLSGHRSKRSIEQGLNLASSLLKIGVDPSAKPCSSFYRFACGSLANQTDFTSASKAWEFHHLSMLYEAISELSSAKNKSSLPNYGKQILQFYEMCTANESFMDWYQVRNVVWDYLRNEDGKLELPLKCPSSTASCNIYDWLGRLHRIFGTNGLFKLNFHDDGIRLMFDISMPDSSFIECFWKQNCHNQTTIKSPQRGKKVLYLRELPEHIASVNWTEFSAKFLDQKQLSRLQQASPIQVDTGKYSYLTNLMNDPVMAAQFFMDHVIYNYFHEQNRSEEYCVKQISQKMATASFRLIFDHNKWNIEEWNADLRRVFSNIQAAFNVFMSNADWITWQEKDRVMQKTASLQFYTGIPDWLTDDIAINERTIFPLNELVGLSYLQKSLNINRELYNDKLDLVNSDLQFINRDPDFTANALYVDTKEFGLNYTRLQGGLLIPPAYHIDYPVSIKYGVVGFIIGHELMHAFNPDNVRNTFSSSSRQFQDRLECTKKQLFSFCDRKQGKCLNGKQHIDEVMSDIDGLKIAYMAMKFATETTAGAIPVPGFASLTNDQTFFTAFSQFYCSSDRYQSATFDHYLDKDTHPPPKARVDIAVGSFPFFAKTFKCQAGSYHVPTKTCSLWGDYHSITMLGQFE